MAEEPDGSQSFEASGRMSASPDPATQGTSSTAGRPHVSVAGSMASRPRVSVVSSLRLPAPRFQNPLIPPPAFNAASAAHLRASSASLSVAPRVPRMEMSAFAHVPASASLPAYEGAYEQPFASAAHSFRSSFPGGWVPEYNRLPAPEYSPSQWYTSPPASLAPNPFAVHQAQAAFQVQPPQAHAPVAAHFPPAPPPPLAFPPGLAFPQANPFAAAAPVFDDRMYAMKRLHDEVRAEREVEAKYRKLGQITSAEPVARARIAQLQYSASKIAEMDRAASVLASRFPADAYPDVAAFATAHSTAASDGVRALTIVMCALARPELGEPEMVRAASRALSKDLSDFSSISGLSSALEDEIEKREAAIAAAAQRAVQRDTSHLTCHICSQVGHIAPYCPSKGKAGKEKQGAVPRAATATPKATAAAVPPEPTAPAS